MITEDYVSFEVAKLLKEKGFNETTYGTYSLEGDLSLTNPDINWNEKDLPFIAAPTLQMAIKWLRDVHNLDIIAPPQFDNSKWTYSAIIFKLSIPCVEVRLNDNKNKKEETCEAAIKYCLTNLIK